MKNDIYTYPYAINENGVPVHIEDISIENRHDHHYHCYGCEAELFPVLGKKRKHHFRHEKGCTCDPNRYLHEFAKATIKKKFDENDTFVVKYNAYQKCKKSDECVFFQKYHWPECERDGLYEIDLKKFYDTCSPEKGFYEDLPDGRKRYVADLLLKHSQKPENKQICIEIWVTHECTDDKKQNAGRIIEIKILKEKDAYRPIIESDDEELPIRFFKFKKSVLTEPSHLLKHIKVVNNDNMLKIERNECSCSDGITLDDDSIYEVVIDPILKKNEEKILFAALCNQSGTDIMIRNHIVCKHGQLVKYGYRRYLSCHQNKCPCPRFQNDLNKCNQIIRKYGRVVLGEKKEKIPLDNHNS